MVPTEMAEATYTSTQYLLVPKYEGQVEWGTPFAMNPGEAFLADDAAYEKNAADLRAELGL